MDNKIYYMLPARIMLIYYGIAYQQGFLLDSFMNFCEITKDIFNAHNIKCAFPDYGQTTHTINTDINTFALRPNGYITLNAPAIKNFSIDTNIAKLLKVALDTQYTQSKSANF